VIWRFPGCCCLSLWAQQTLRHPEATGRIVCANCHLAAKPAEVEVPQSILPDTVFEAVVKFPDTNVQQVVADGSKGGLNVGAVLMLPEASKLRIGLRDEGESWRLVSITKNRKTLLVGPIPGEQYQEIIFQCFHLIRQRIKTCIMVNIPFIWVPTGDAVKFTTGEKSNNTVLQRFRSWHYYQGQSRR